MKVPNTMKAVDCFFREIEYATKNKVEVAPGIEKCIAAFEEKRTAKWQAIFDKMKN